MRRTRLALPWSASVMLFGVLASGCATTTPSAEEGLRVDPNIARPTAEEVRERNDSARAQAVADEVGPRVTITADFDYAGGSRQVQARFHMYDDAYVIVGHLDAAGRMKIVFPSQPGDDGFVRGDKIYYVPTFFAGFADEYAWRYSEYRYRFHDAASRNDSYDAGLGYVFVIASWRPMRLDRISDGSRWQTYDVSDISYMQDPREAIEELGSVIAGDNREAYTIQYAHYTTTNFGTYALSDFDAVNSGCYGSLGFVGFAPRSLFFSPFLFGFPYASSGCGSAYNGLGYPFGYYAYGYPAFGTPRVFPGLNGPPRISPPVGTPPVGGPIFHRPNLPGVVASHKPEGQSVTPLAPMGSASTANGSSAYRRPGLITQDAPRTRGEGRAHDVNAAMPGIGTRPTIQDMVGGRRIDDGARAFGRADAGIRDNTGWASRQPTWTNRGGGANVTSHPREEGGVYRSQGSRGFESPRGGSSYTPPSRVAPSSGTPHYSQPAPSHAAPAVRSAPPPSSSSSGSKKP
jgi:hypothetical protein